jgi:hypothetical protein
MKWKVVFLGPTGTVCKDTSAFCLLYAFPMREEAEAHANCFRSVSKVAICDEHENLVQIPKSID